MLFNDIRCKASSLPVVRFADLTPYQQETVMATYTFYYKDAQFDFFYGVDDNGHVYQRYLRHQVEIVKPETKQA